METCEQMWPVFLMFLLMLVVLIYARIEHDRANRAEWEVMSLKAFLRDFHDELGDLRRPEQAE